MRDVKQEAQSPRKETLFSQQSLRGCERLQEEVASKDYVAAITAAAWPSNEAVYLNVFSPLVSLVCK